MTSPSPESSTTSGEGTLAGALTDDASRDDASREGATHEEATHEEATDDGAPPTAASGTDAPATAAPRGDRVASSRADLAALLVQEGDIAGDYLEQFLDIIDFDGDIDMDVEGDRASVAIVGETLSALIGPRGATLDALQELTRLAVLHKTGMRSRLMLDVGGYRARRRLELVAIAKNAAERVKSHGDAFPMDAMNPFERKVVHDAVADIDGVKSESEGEEPDRRVVVLPAY